ncbi:YolD-like family protein [Pseudoneobacillus sp. C159]
MTIRDRGKMKWQEAFFMPEHVKLLGDIRSDYFRTRKPELDENQFDEFDELLGEAMATNVPIKVSFWRNGFESEIVGVVQELDTLNRVLHIEVKPGEYERVIFEEIIKIKGM